MEAVGLLWFERLIEDLGHELWIGDAAQTRASYVRRQKTDRRDAGIFCAAAGEAFSSDLDSFEVQRDQRQLLLHRHRLVQMQTKVKTELQHLALNQGLQQKRSLWRRRGEGWSRKAPLGRLDQTPEDGSVEGAGYAGRPSERVGRGGG